MLRKVINILIITFITGTATVRGQWFTQVSAVPDNLYGVHFINKDTGFVAGGSLNDSRILRTTNGGDHWENISFTQSKWLYDIAFINDSTGITCGYNGVIYKTTDYGSSWSARPSETTDWLYSIDFLNKDTGFITGVNGRIIKTVNGGNNWTSITSNINAWILDIDFYNDTIGFVCGEDGRIFKTTDGGLHWDEKSNVINTTLNDIWIVNPDTIYMVGETGTIMLSADSGETWNAVFSNTTQHLKSIRFKDAGHGYIVGETIILQTADGGASWISMPNPVTVGLYGLSIVKDATTAFAVGKNGAILKNDFTTGIENENPSTNCLVFPNPCKDYVHIQLP